VLELIGAAPCHGARFLRALRFEGRGPESEDQIVMQVQRLAAARRDRMYIHAN
jgi:hypothetical protein